MAPEVLAHQRYSTKADVFSFAIVLWEFLTRRLPYAGMVQLQVRIASCRCRCRCIRLTVRSASGPIAGRTPANPCPAGLVVAPSRALHGLHPSEAFMSGERV